LIGAAVAAVLYPILGLLSQRFGRRPTITVIGLLNLVPACVLYYVLVTSGYRDPTTLIILVALVMMLSLPIWAVWQKVSAPGRAATASVTVSLP
jgi:hypothetical protein